MEEVLKGVGDVGMFFVFRLMKRGGQGLKEGLRDWWRGEQVIERIESVQCEGLCGGVKR